MTGNKSHTSNRPLIAVTLILIGLIAFAGLGILFELFWPVFFILLPGLVMLWIAVAGGKIGAVFMAIPGMIVAGTGAMMFVQNLTGYWESWAYAWTLYGAFLGLAFTLIGQRLEEETFATLGRWFVYSGLAAFAVFGAFFELLIFNSLGPLLPVLLIAAGLYLLTRDGAGAETIALLKGHNKPKSKPKAKRAEEKLFTGPVVYGSTVRAGSDARVAVVDLDRQPSE